VGLNQKAFGNLRHVRKTCKRLRAKVEYTPGSGPFRGTAGKVSIHQAWTALKLRKATEYPLETKDHFKLIPIHNALPVMILEARNLPVLTD
jgi:hypothetical protein